MFWVQSRGSLCERLSFKHGRAGRNGHTSRTPVKLGPQQSQSRQGERFMFRNSESQQEHFSKDLYTDNGVKSNTPLIFDDKTLVDLDRTGPKSEIEGGLFVFGEIHEIQVKLLVDTGASVCVLSKKIFDQLPEHVKSTIKPRNYPVMAAGGASLSHYGEISLDIAIDSNINTCLFTVAEVVDDGILGLPFLNQTSSKIDFGKREFTIDNQEVDCFDREGNRFSQTVRCSQTVTIPGRCQLVIGAMVSRAIKGREMVIEPSRKFLAKRGILVAKSVTQSEGRRFKVRVCNPLNEPVTVYRGTNLGMMSPVATLRAMPTQTQRVNRVTVANPTVPEHLVDLYNRSVSEIDQEYHDSVAQLLCKNADVFSKNDKDLGRTSVTQHDINTGDEKPIKLPPRRFPPGQEKEIEKQINDLLDSGLIKPGNGPWGSPLVLVKKKDGSIRMCVDYRKLNSKTVKDAYQLPRIDDTLDWLANARYFSTLDLASGYHQVSNTPKAKVKSAMVTKQGLFEWEVMSFGLTGAPATFQRAMEEIMRGLNYEILWIYLDDVILLGYDVEQMIERLQLVFDRFRAANLKLKPKKCNLFKTELEFLGHIVSAKGVSTDPKKTQRVSEWPVPRNVSEVRSFLGLAGYYRRFVPKYYEVAKPCMISHKYPEKGNVESNSSGRKKQTRLSML